MTLQKNKMSYESNVGEMLNTELKPCKNERVWNKALLFIGIKWLFLHLFKYVLVFVGASCTSFMLYNAYYVLIVKILL